MSIANKITLFELKEQYKKGIRIPEIQRDYVMGAGGKTENGEDKLSLLLDAILEKCKKDEDFDFSCIITYCKDKNVAPLEIYDGQQRLTTLLLLTLYKLRMEKSTDTPWNKFSKWYTFAGRSNADKIIEKLTDDREFNYESIEVSDFTTFSMHNLLEVFSREEYKEITSDYLLNRVKFDRVELGSQSEIEQFFMDLNSGVKLKEYELYKAKLVNKVYLLEEKCSNEFVREKLQEWPHRLDNQWMNMFKTFADFSHPAAEYEIAFIQYCFEMLALKWGVKIEEKKVPISEMSTDILMDCFEIMNSLTKINFYEVSSKKKKELPVPICVEFAWGTKNECQRLEKDINFDKRGAYWNLQNEDYEYQLYYIIKRVLLDRKQKDELKKDTLLWAYITTLKWKIDYQYEYLRLLKIIMNRDYWANYNAWYECQNKGQYLYYSKYSVRNIPQYYGEHLKDNSGKSLLRREEILQMHFILSNYLGWERNLDRMKVSKNIMNQIIQSRCGQGVKTIVDDRLDRLNKSQEDYAFFCGAENEKCGYVGDVQEGYYLGKDVIFSWPTRSGSSYKEKCMVLLKCDVDKILDGYNYDYDNRFVSTYFDKEYEVDKMYWSSEDNNLQGYKIKDRKIETSKTYARYESDTEYWATKYTLENGQLVSQDI